MAVVITGNNTPTAGGITYGDGTTYAVTAAGTSGRPIVSGGAGAPTFRPYTLPAADGSANQILKTDGAGALSFATPSTGALVFISSVTASDSATVSFTSLNSTYDVYMVELVNIVTLDAFLQFQMSTNNGSSYAATDYRYSSIGGSNTSNAAEVDSLTGNATFIRLMCNNTGSISATASHGGLSGFAHVISPAASNFTRVMFQESHAVNATTNGFSFGSGMYASSTPVNAIKFFMSSSENIVSGTFRLYGIANS